MIKISFSDGEQREGDGDIQLLMPLTACCSKLLPHAADVGGLPHATRRRCAMCRLGSSYKDDATAVRRRYDHSSTYTLTTISLPVRGLLHCGLNKTRSSADADIPAPRLGWFAFQVK